MKKEPLTSWWDNGNNQIGFCRGRKGLVFLNNDASDIYSRFLACLPAGIYCDVISGRKVNGKCTGRNVTIGEHGDSIIRVPKNGGMIALHTGVGVTFNNNY